MKKCFVFATFALWMSAAALYAETKVWTGLSTNLPPQWNDPDNWKPSVPTETDDVVIGEPPYNFPAHISVEGEIKLKSLLLNRTMLIGNANVRVGSFTSKGCDFSGAGTLTITTDATLLRNPTGDYALTVDGWDVVNEGAITVSTYGIIKFFSHPGTFINVGTVDLADFAGIDGVSAPGSAVENHGTISKSSGTERATINFVNFHNAGQIVSSSDLYFTACTINAEGQMSGSESGYIYFEGSSVALNGVSMRGVSIYAQNNTTLIVQQPSEIDYLHLNGDITGAATLEISQTFKWISGTLFGPGTIHSADTLTIEDPPGGGVHNIHGAVLEANTSVHWDSGNLSITEDGYLQINEGANMFVSDSADKQISSDVSAPGGFLNLGEITFVYNQGHKTSIYCRFSNLGTVRYGSQVFLYGGGLHSGAFYELRFGDEVGHLEFDADENEFRRNATIECATPVVIRGGVVLLTGNLQADYLELAGGVIDGEGDLTVPGGFLWSGGTIRGTGKVNIPDKAILDWGQFNTPRELTQRTIELAGEGYWNGVNFTMSDGGTIRILPGGMLLTGASESIDRGPGALPVIENHGTFIKGRGIGTAYVAPKFVNSARVWVEEGTLQFAGQFDASAGSVTVETGGHFAALTGWMNSESSEIAGTGDFAGDVTNEGRLRPGHSPGLLTLKNNLAQTPKGRLEIEIGGHQAGIDFDQLKALGKATLDGELQVKLLNGFVPAAGDRFEIMNFDSRSGQFKINSGTLIATNLALLPEYSATKLTLVATAVSPEFPALSVVGESSNGNKIWSWPATDGHNYQVEFSPDLSSWLFYTNLTATSSSIQFELPAPGPDSPARFYRVH